MAWAAQPDLVPAGDDDERDTFMAARRAAIVTAIQRLFPTTARNNTESETAEP